MAHVEAHPKEVGYPRAESYDMPRRGDSRILITLGCTECRERTYPTSKNRRNDSDRLELRKFCPRCRLHTLHREVR